MWNERTRQLRTLLWVGTPVLVWVIVAGLTCGRVAAASTVITNAAQRTEEVVGRMRALSALFATGESTNGIPLVDWSIDWKNLKAWPDSVVTGGSTNFIVFLAGGRGIDYSWLLTRDEPTPPGLSRSAYYRPLDWKSDHGWSLRGLQPGAKWNTAGVFDRAHLYLGAMLIFQVDYSSKGDVVMEFWWRDSPDGRFKGEFYGPAGEVVGTAWMHQERLPIYKRDGKTVRAAEFWKHYRAIHNLPDPPPGSGRELMGR